MDSQQINKPNSPVKQVQESINEAERQQVFEQLETQHYQLVLPAEYEELRGYLQNDGLLSDEEITKCLYDESLRRKDLDERIEEKTPTADSTERKKLTDYLWDVHSTVKGLPLTFVDPKLAYRVDVVDTGNQPLAIADSSNDSLRRNKSTAGGQVNPVTLHLDINGGFLANFLHNARLNHEQMNRFIEDLERQHKELKTQMDQYVPQKQALAADSVGPENSHQFIEKSEPIQSDLRRIYGTVTNGKSASLAPASISQSHRANNPIELTDESIVNQLTNITMNETSTPGVEPTVANRQTRYQWQEVSSQFEKLGVTRQDLEKTGQLDDLLNGRKTGLMKLTQVGDEGKPFQISGKLYIVNTPDKGPNIGIQPERKQLLLPKEFLGYELTARDKQNLEKNGEMGKRVELTDKMTGKKFTGYVGVDKETKSLTVLRAERLHIPQTIKGVTLNKQQQKSLEQGRAIKLAGMTGNNGQSFNAYVQVSAAKRSLTFAKIPDTTIKQTVDQKTAQDLTKPVHQLKGDGAGGKKTIQPKDEQKQETAQKLESPKPVKQQKIAAPKPTIDGDKPKRSRKQKGPGIQ